MIIGIKINADETQDNNVHNFIYNFMQNAVYVIEIPLTYLKPPGDKYNYHKSYTNHSFDTIYPQLEAITESTVVEVLIKAGILPKVKKPRKPKEEKAA